MAYVIPFGVRRPVQQDWVCDLTFMQQSVLFCAMRGPDGIRKEHPVKVLCRWLRRSVLISAFERKPLLDPYEEGGGSFTGKFRATPECATFDEVREVYLKSVDELPHHFHLHMMHAAEIIGYKHPDTVVRLWWNTFYRMIVNDAHLYPEMEIQMDRRLGDYENHWRERETVIAHEKIEIEKIEIEIPKDKLSTVYTQKFESSPNDIPELDFRTYLGDREGRYKTDEPIPDDILKMIEKNQAQGPARISGAIEDIQVKGFDSNVLECRRCRRMFDNGAEIAVHVCTGE